MADLSKADYLSKEWADQHEPGKLRKAIRKDYREAREKFAGGLERSADCVDLAYHLISPHALNALARRHAIGLKKYGDGNASEVANLTDPEKGIPGRSLIDHAMYHLNQWRAGDESDDHLGGVLWNVAMLVHYSKERPELLEGCRGSAPGLGGWAAGDDPPVKGGETNG